jgi:tetratricopeptide (TPR) repeat protein
LGSLNQRPSGELAVTANIADVASGELRPGVSSATSLDDILQAEKELAFRLFDQLDVALTPAERSAVEQLPTKNVAAFLAYSRGVRFDVEGRYPEARAEFQQALKLDPQFHAAQEHLESVEAATAPPVSEQEAGSSAARVAERVTDGINGVFVSPLGSLFIAPPGEGGSDLVLPTTITITVGVEP